MRLMVVVDDGHVSSLFFSSAKWKKNRTTDVSTGLICATFGRSFAPPYLSYPFKHFNNGQ